MTTPTSLPVYTQGFGTAFTGATFVAPFAPGATNVVGPSGPFKVGQLWIDSSTQEAFILTGLQSFNGITTAVWQQVSSSTGLLETLTGDSGGAIAPVAGNIAIISAGGLFDVAGTPGKLTITSLPGGYPISPYVVGPVGRAGYQTIQSAINAANTAGGGVVYIQPGSYTENLTIFTGVSLFGTNVNTAYPFPVSAFQITITGTHTVTPGVSPLPIGIDTLNFVAVGNVFSNVAAVPVGMIINNSNFRCSGNYVISLPALTFTANVYFVFNNSNIFDGGFVDIPSGSVAVTNSSLAINGSVPTMVNNGTWTFNNVSCPAPISGTGNLIALDCIFNDTVTVAGSGTLGFNDCLMFTDVDPCITANGNAQVQLTGCILGSSATNVINGNTLGSVFLSAVTFTLNAAVLPTLSVTVQSTSLSSGALVGTIVPEASAVMTVASTTQGFLPPRMTTLQKDAIVAPTAGLVLYDTTLNQLSYYNGTAWVAL